MNEKSARRALARAIVILSFASALSSAARGQVILRLDENVNFRFGIAVQAWADWAQDSASRGYVQNLFLRRVRFYFSGQVAPKVSFFVVPVSSNLGKAPKDSNPNFFLEDGYLEWQVANSFILDGGQILIPLCRNCLEQTVRQLTLDLGTFSFLANGVTQSVSGRDVGFQAKGYVFGDRLEYRIGTFEGRREPGSRNAYRSAGRVQYNFFDTERGQFYPGTYLGTKKILAIGAGYDLQGQYRAYAGDLFLDLPIGAGNGLTAQFDFLRWNGGTTFPTLLRQNDVFFEAGYYFSSVRLMPWGRFENQAFSDSAASSNDQKRVQAGLTWYPQGHNFNVRAAYGRVMPRAASVSSTNQFTVQLQLFYY